MKLDLVISKLVRLAYDTTSIATLTEEMAIPEDAKPSMTQDDTDQITKQLFDIESQIFALRKLCRSLQA